jgi:hypothetical protein
VNHPASSHIDSRPWYRQFWPWFLIVLPGTVVIAALWTLVIANRHADDLVVDDYYREGLAINRQLARQDRARILGLDATLSLSGRQLSVAVAGAAADQQLRLTLSHPMEAERDLVLPLTRIDTDLYRVELPVALTGRWHWIIDAGTGSDWRLDGNVHF